jgi:hypothetical protein
MEQKQSDKNPAPINYIVANRTPPQRAAGQAGIIE